MNQIAGNIKIFFEKHASWLNILILALLSYLFLFHNLGLYPLIDIDETRYVNMSRDMLSLRDYVTPYLNFEPFLEKPPLYFWLNIISYNIFSDTGVFASRFANALLAAFSVFCTYFFAAYTMKSRAYGLISACVLLTSAWFLVLSHIAILDMGFMALSMATIYCAMLALYVPEKGKKYCWWTAYFFMALSTLAKGLIGIIVPAMVVFLSYLAMRRAKELFKPIFILPGILIFLLVALPWHILVFKAHGVTWFNDYIVKHHFARFIDSSLGLGRKQPFLFYVPIVLAGVMPYTIEFLVQIWLGIKSAIKNVRITKSFKTIFSTDTNDKKMIVFAVIYALSTLIFFSISSSKLPTYALALFPALALIIGYFWWGYVCFDKYSKGARVSSAVMFIIFIIAAIFGAMFIYASPAVISKYAGALAKFAPYVCGWFITVPLIGLIFVLFKKRFLIFITKIIFMLGVMIIATVHFFPFITSFGQNELEDFARLASSNSYETELITFGFQRKYSLMNNYDAKIYYIIQSDPIAIDELRTTVKHTDKTIYLIIKNDTLDALQTNSVFGGFSTVKQGSKYSLLKK